MIWALETTGGPAHFYLPRRGEDMAQRPVHR